MQFSTLSALVVGFSALASATFSSPKAGDQWQVGKEQTLSWDNTGMSGLMDCKIIPAGAVDTSIVIAEVFSQIDIVSTGGSYKWTPDASLISQSVTIVIIDSLNQYHYSESFTLIVAETTIVNIGGEGNYNNGKVRDCAFQLFQTITNDL
jgi:hypothetical protein